MVTDPTNLPTERDTLSGSQDDTRKDTSATAIATTFFILASKKLILLNALEAAIEVLAPYYASAGHCILRLTPN